MTETHETLIDTDAELVAAARDALLELTTGDLVSKREVARRLEVDAALVRRWEKGERPISPAQAQQIINLRDELVASMNQMEARQRDRESDAARAQFLTPYAELAMSDDPLYLLDGANGLHATPHGKGHTRPEVVIIWLGLLTLTWLASPLHGFLLTLLVALPYLLGTAWAALFIDSSLDHVSKGGVTLVTGYEWPTVRRRIEGGLAVTGFHIRRVIYLYSGAMEAHKQLARENLEAAFAQKFPTAAFTSRWHYLLRIIVFHRVPRLPVGKTDYRRPGWSEWWKLPVGQGVYGDWEYIDLKNKPHTILSGETGSGKTSWLLVVVAWLLPFVVAGRIRLVVADPKRMDFRKLKGLAARVPGLAYLATDEEMSGGLKAAYEEMVRRQAHYEEHETKDWQPIVYIQDEAGEMQRRARDIQLDRARTQADENERYIQSLVALGRSVDIHLIISTQQPNVKAIGGTTEARDQLGNIVMAQEPDNASLSMLTLKSSDIPDIEEKGHVAVKSDKAFFVAHVPFIDPTRLLEEAGVE